MSALLLLFRLKARGAFRGWWRSFRTPEGALRGVFALMFVGLMILPLIGFRIFSSRTFPEQYTTRCTYFVDNILPLVLGFMFFMALAKPNSG